MKKVCKNLERGAYILYVGGFRMIGNTIFHLYTVFKIDIKYSGFSISFKEGDESAD